MCGALLGVPKTSRDWKKDCGKPGCPNDHHGQVLARGDEVIEKNATSAYGTFRTWRDVRVESAFGGKAEVGLRVVRAAFDPDCVKTPTSNLRVESLSRLG